MNWIVYTLDGWSNVVFTTECTVPAGPARVVYVKAVNSVGESDPSSILIPDSVRSVTISWDGPSDVTYRFEPQAYLDAFVVTTKYEPPKPDYWALLVPIMILVAMLIGSNLLTEWWRNRK